MHLMRLFAVLAFSALVGVTLTGWHYTIGFNPLQPAWWQWLLDFWRQARGFPTEVLQPAYAGFGAFLVLMVTGTFLGRVLVLVKRHVDDVSPQEEHSHAEEDLCSCT